MSSAIQPSPAELASDTVPCSLRELLGYFLWLGSFGFGGPIALAGYMQRDLVDAAAGCHAKTT